MRLTVHREGIGAGHAVTGLTAKRPYGFVTAVVLSLSAFAHAAGAQIFQPPPRSGVGAPPALNGAQQQLTVQTDVLGGYDDNLAGPAGGAPFASHPSGYVGFGE